MKYPNNIKKNYQKVINYKNRGMNLEEIINDACSFYIHADTAIIYKKPTPIGVVEVDYKNNKKEIKKAYFKEPSTLDYNGIYMGKYIEFDAKECHSKTSFPISNIHDHQIKHMRNIIKHKGICFLIISMNNNYYLLKGEDILNFIDTEKRKSIPFKTITELGYQLFYSYSIGLKFIDGVNILYKELIYDEIKN